MLLAGELFDPLLPHLPLEHWLVGHDFLCSLGSAFETQGLDRKDDEDTSESYGDIVESCDACLMTRAYVANRFKFYRNGWSLGH